MAHELDSVRLKVLRAEEHLRELEREIAAWEARRAYAVVGCFDEETSDYVLRFRVFEPTPERWGLLVGDCVHNARSALDHLACRLAELNTGRDAGKIQFPIFTDCDEYESKGRWRIKKLDPRHQQMIEDLQPFKRDVPRLVYEHPLAILSELDNADKHRVLVPAIAAPRTLGCSVLEAVDCVVPDENAWQPNWEPLEDGAEVFRLPVVRTGENPDLRLDKVVHVEVTLLPYGERAAETLNRIVAEVWDVLDAFMDDFG